MRKLKDALRFAMAKLCEREEQARIAVRVCEVHDMWRNAIQTLYGEKASYILDRVNAVYIKTEPGRREGEHIKQMIVYMDDSTFRAEIHNQQSFITMFLKMEYGEEIDEFKVLPSRGGMKQRHPFWEKEQNRPHERKTKQLKALSTQKVKEELTPSQQKMVSEACSLIEQEAVKRSFEKAMKTSLSNSNK